MKIEIGSYGSYIRIKECEESDKPLTQKMLDNDVVLDYSKDGKLIGIELLGSLEVIEEDDD